MPELETEIRDLLRERAREARPAPEAPPGVLHRARRRRTGTLAVSGAVAVALIASAFVVVRALPVGEGAIVRPGGDTATWPDSWPHATREEAEAAQEAAAAGDPAFTWQLDPDRVAERWAREVGGFEPASIVPFPEGDGGTVRRVLECDPSRCGQAPTHELQLEQPFGGDGIWIVTEVARGTTDAVSMGAAGAKRAVRSFLRARIDEDRAALPQIATPGALHAYETGEGGLSLFGYQEGVIRSTEAADANSFEIVIVLRTADGAEVAERLFVGLGISAEDTAFVIRGAMLEG